MSNNFFVFSRLMAQLVLVYFTFLKYFCPISVVLLHEKMTPREKMTPPSNTTTKDMLVREKMTPPQYSNHGYARELLCYASCVRK